MALTVASPGNRQSLAAVRAWWRVTHPAPSLARRLDVLYTAAIVIAIFGALAYGTASSALAQVVTADRLAVFGPSLAMISMLAAAQWGAYQGPVVFSLADVAHLLGAPLPRRGLVVRRLAVALAGGGVAGAVASAVLIVGLAGRGRGVAADQAAGLTVALAELGVLAFAATWAVQRSARCERTVRRASWLVLLVAAALALASDAGQVGRRIALWSGPWGWAVQSGASVHPAERLAALLTLTLVTAAAAAAAIRDSGGCPTERHLRRAEGRASAIASLTSFDARTARQAIEAVGARTSRTPGDLGRLRAAIASRGARPSTRTLAIVWRDAVATVRAPGRAVEAAALLAKLFEPFERLGAESTQIEGTGLGLALSKGMLEAMGGTIEAASALGAGTTITIELAGSRRPAEAGESVPDDRRLAELDARAGTRRLILYIEDNLSNLTLVERILDRYPAVGVIPAMQATIGLELAREHHPDLIVLDLHLPDIPGADVLKRLKADPSTREIPVVVLTADASKGQSERVRRLGAAVYLTKPLDVHRFLEAIADNLSGLSAGGS